MAAGGGRAVLSWGWQGFGSAEEKGWRQRASNLSGGRRHESTTTKNNTAGCAMERARMDRLSRHTVCK